MSVIHSRNDSSSPPKININFSSHCDAARDDKSQKLCASLFGHNFNLRNFNFPQSELKELLTSQGKWQKRVGEGLYRARDVRFGHVTARCICRDVVETQKKLMVMTENNDEPLSAKMG